MSQADTTPSCDEQCAPSHRKPVVVGLHCSAAITGLPIAWERNGRQYITVLSGAATVCAALAGDPELANVPAGGSVWTVALPK